MQSKRTPTSPHLARPYIAQSLEERVALRADTAHAVSVGSYSNGGVRHTGYRVSDVHAIKGRSRPIQHVLLLCIRPPSGWEARHSSFGLELSASVISSSGS